MYILNDLYFAIREIAATGKSVDERKKRVGWVFYEKILPGFRSEIESSCISGAGTWKSTEISDNEADKALDCQYGLDLILYGEPRIETCCTGEVGFGSRVLHVLAFPFHNPVFHVRLSRNGRFENVEFSNHRHHMETGKRFPERTIQTYVPLFGNVVMAMVDTKKLWSHIDVERKADRLEQSIVSFDNACFYRVPWGRLSCEGIDVEIWRKRM